MRTSFVGLCLGAVIGACGGAAGDDDCPIGSNGCACTQGGGCDGGLLCVGGTCLPDGEASTGGGPGGTAGDATSSAMTTMTPGSDAASADTTAADGASTMASADTGGGPKLDVGAAETGVGPAQGCASIDMLFVLDSSASMIEERAALAATDAFTQIVDTLAGLNGGGIDYRIGVTDDKDSGLKVPAGWAGPDPWFDASTMTTAEVATAFNGAVAAISGEPPLGCEHVLTSATDLLVGSGAGFVRPDALLVLVLLTDVDDYGAYDQLGGNSCGIGCETAPPHTVDQIVGILGDTVKGGVPGALATIVIAGDPGVAGGANFCGQPGSCCGGFDCSVYHADRLYAFADALGTNGYAANLCTANVPSAVETALTDNIDLACMNFEPEG